MGDPRPRLVERRTGLPFADYLRQEIVEPLGLGFVLPVPADRFEEVVAVPITHGSTQYLDWIAGETLAP